MKLLASLFFLILTQDFYAQNLHPGDIAVLGMSANTFNCTGTPGGDEVSFVCFKDVFPGSFIDITDNGWERCLPNRWGDSEGAIRFTRTGNTIPAGTVITFRLTNPNSFGTYQFVSPDNNWAVTNLNTGLPPATAVNLNAGGDQLFFLAGGDWQNGGITQDNDATYTGVILFGFNTKNVWQASCSNAPTQNSNLPPSLSPCNKMEPTGASDFSKYTGLMTAATQLEWIDRLRNPANWSFFSDCQKYENTAPNYASGLKINILSTQFGISGGPNGVCLGDTAHLGLLLPPVGAPFTIGWSDGSKNYSASNIFNGGTLPVVPLQSGIFQITFLQDNSGCALQTVQNGGIFLEVYPSDTSKVSQTTCRPSEVGIFTEKYKNRWGCDSIVMRQVVFDAVACRVSFDFSKKNVSCNGFADGLMFAVPTAGSPPFDVFLKNEWTGQIWQGQVLQLRDSFLQKNLSPATFFIKITDANGVADSARFNIIESPPLAGSIRRLSDFSGYALQCASSTDGKARVEIVGGNPPYQILWQNGIKNAQNDALTAGTATVSVTDALGCQLVLSVLMNAPDSLVAQLSARGESCAGKNNGEIRVEKMAGGVLPYLFSIENQAFSSNQYWKNLPPGLFKINVQDAVGCQKSFKAVLPEGTGYDFSIGNDTCIFSGEQLVRLPKSSRRIDSLIFQPAGYARFDPTTGAAIFAPPAGLTFAVTALDEVGCVARDTIQFCLLRDRSIFVPNAFYPNSEIAENQRLTIFSDSGVEEILAFRVFNRLGGVVFECFNFLPNDYTNSWDGKVRGQPATPGVFVWHLVFRANDGRTHERKGEVMLVR